MPFRRDARRRFAILIICAAATAALLAQSTPASATLGVACPGATSQPFRTWNDSAAYAYAPNGGFESGTAGWTLSGGAAVTTGNEPYYTQGAGTHSLALPSGSSAVTPPMCIGLLSTKMRLFARNPGASSAQLHVQVIYNGGTAALLGGLGATLGIADAGYITGNGVWQPTPAISMLGGTLPLLTQSVQFRFTPVGRSGEWQIDDVYLDPLMHR